MIVYGDPRRVTSIGAAVADLRHQADAITATREPASPDAVRRLTMVAGCVEQAVHDAVEGEHLPRSCIATAEAVTNAAAELFLSTWRDARDPNPRTRLSAALHALDKLPANVCVTIKSPEGFAFYTLYPEQYCAAADAWMSSRRAPRGERVVVVGIRSIGTTLSAVVEAALLGRGWSARRCTVRPHGPYAERRVDIDASIVDGATWALIVDEGPGLSGSTMASVADALVRRGLTPDRIVFMPGHDGLPGSMASGTVSQWWTSAHRVVSSWESVRLGGRSLIDTLADATVTALGVPVVGIDDLSGGRWRSFVYDDEARWPAVDAGFERTKLRCVLADGRAVLWKFGGIDDQLTFDELTRRAGLGVSPEPVGIANGFVGTPWLPGAALSTTDAHDIAVLDRVAAYIAAVCGPPMRPAERIIAAERLAEMLFWNTHEALGSAVADCVRRATGHVVQSAELDEMPTYGDGRMAPAEWRTGDGRLLKLNGVGHARDHTMVGSQPVLWDVAGVLVEWQLDAVGRSRFLERCEHHLGATISPLRLQFYEMSYTAFRLGMATVCAPAHHVCGAEKSRSDAAISSLGTRLTELSDQVGTTGRSSTVSVALTASTRGP